MSYRWIENNYPPTIYEGIAPNGDGIGGVTCGLHTTGWRKYFAGGDWYDSVDTAKEALIMAYEQRELK